MKRDARIGLAVVLVLGLAVTLLVGRAIYKRSPQPNAEGDIDATLADNGSASGSGSGAPAAEPRRTDPVDSSVSAPLPVAGPLPVNSGTGAQPSNIAVRQLIDEPAGRAPVGGSTAPVILPPAPISAHERVTGGHGRTVAGDVRGNPPAIQPLEGNHDEDHEQISGPPANLELIQKEGLAYTVASGDNMWKISAKVYGDGKYTQKILEANPHLNAQKMKVGTLVRIPMIANKTVLMKLPTFSDAGAAVPNVAVGERATAESHVKAPAKEKETAAPVAGGAATTHKVESGETLSSIAKKYFGTAGPKTIARISAANKGLDASKLKVGQEINIPAAPAAAPAPVAPAAALNQ